MIRKHKETNLQTNPEGEITKLIKKLKGKIKVISVKFPEDDNINVLEETEISFENDLGVILKYPANNKDFYDYPKVPSGSGIFTEISEESNMEQMTITGNLILRIRNAGANKTISAIEIVLED